MKSLLLLMLIAAAHAQLDMNKQLSFDDNIAEESQSDEQIFTSVTSKPILNDGKPFIVARDPTTGNLDFNIKKTVGLSNDIPVSRKDELSGNSKSGHDINSLGQNNFHDFLNLPVKYSSSKFVYPLISGSYANLKYQGNNKNHVSNHKNYTTTVGTTTQSPKFFTHITSPVKNIFTATFKHPETTAGTVKITTHRPTTLEKLRTTTTPTTTTTTTEAPQTTQSTTVKYSSTIVQNSFPSTFKNKYVDSSETRKKSTTATTATKVHQTSTPPAHPVKFIDYDDEVNYEMKETKPTTYRPPLSSNTRLSFSTSMPLQPSAFKPLPTESPNNYTNKIVFETSPKNPSVLSLSEIINSFTGNDNLSHEQNAIPYETADSSQIEVRKPAPSTFAPTATLPPTHKTLQQQLSNQQKPLNFAPPTGHVGFPGEQIEDYVEFENPEDVRYANQYVKYEVQKPNVDLVKFKQVPSMNNVVISPGQNSASFVLGSQQSVGSVGVGSSLGVGTSHFADNNNGPIKQGQVINDDPPIRSPANPINNQMQASIRFPSDSGHDFDNAPIVKGTIKLDASEVQPPQALSQNVPPTKQPLVFPVNPQPGSNSMSADVSFGLPAPTPTNPSQVIFENVNDIYEKINDKRQKQEISGNELSNNINLTPPQILTPPSPSPQRPFNRPPPQQQFNIRRPGPNRPNIPGLPNILPQFRPNAKASGGHPHVYKDVGAIRVPVQGGNLFPNQGPNQYPGQGPNKFTNLGPNQFVHQGPNQHPGQGQNQHPGQGQNQHPGQGQNQHPGQGQNQHPGQGQNQHPGQGQNQHPGQGQNQHPGQGQNQHPGQGQNQYQGQGPNQHQNQGPPSQFPMRQYPAPKVGLPPMMGPQHSPNPNVRLIPTRQYVTRITGPSHPPKNPNFEQSNTAENRRLFRVPQPPMNDYVFMKPPPFTPPGFQMKKYHFSPETLQMQQRPTNLPQPPEFELNKSSPPQALTQFPPKPLDSEEDTNSTKLEPVITLQMLQNKKNGGSSKLNLPAVPHDIPQDLQGPIPSNHKEDLAKKPSVYVVYPVSSNSFESDSPIQNPSDEIFSSGDGKIPEYQNTPFSVVSHFEQEPLLMKKDKKKNQFPYHLERPAHTSDSKTARPTYTFDGSVYNIGEEPSRILNKPQTFSPDYHEAAISSKLTRVTEKPIAIAYTPTEPNRNYPPPTKFYQGMYPEYSHYYDSKFSSPNYGGPVISEILDEKRLGFDYYHKQQQLQQHLNNGEDLDFYKEHYDFQAPFQASVSLNPEVTNPYEGWSIVTQSTDTNKIDRADLNVADSSEELTTKSFDPNEFQPIYESGFQPIYSERRVSTAPELFAESNEISSALPLIDSTHSIISTSTTPLPSTTSLFETSSQISSSDETSTTKTDKSKQKVEIDSLEAFFESLTRDYDDDESANKSENESRSL